MRKWTSLAQLALILALPFMIQMPARRVDAAGTAWCSLGIAGIALMPDAKTYALELSSEDGTPLSARLQLYSDAAEYGATLTGVTFSKITPSEATALRMSARFVSAPIFVTLPKLDFLTAARAVLAGSAVQTAKSCSPRFGYTDFYLRQLVPGYDASANWVAWRQQRADAFAHSPTVTAAALVSDSPPSCDRPNAVVGVAQLVQPTYPRLAREQGISGTAVIKVDVDESGSVTSATIFQSAGDTSLDIAALNSARQSKYSPETFRCLSIPATYLFPMTFGKPQNNTDKKQY